MSVEEIINKYENQIAELDEVTKKWLLKNAMKQK